MINLLSHFLELMLNAGNDAVIKKKNDYTISGSTAHSCLEENVIS